MFDGLKKFILRGNIVDMATGIIVGAAFTAIVKSLVDDIITPPLGLLLSGIDFKNFFYVLKEGASTAPYLSIEAAQAAGAITLNYGLFLNSVLSFLIIAVVIYAVISQMAKFQKQSDEKPVPPSSEEKVLLEIRDLLKK